MAPVVALEDVFDDPAHGEPGQDRMSVHLLWETVLLLFTVALVFLVRDARPEALRGEELRETLVLASAIGLLALGAGLSLRAAVPNLAVGTLGVACAMFFAKSSTDGGMTLSMAALVTVLVAGGVGLVLAVLVVGFHVPAWAASFGAALAIMVWLEQQGEVTVADGTYLPSEQGWYWIAGFVGVAVLAGLLGAVRPLRRTIGRFRAISDPGHRRGTASGAIAGMALIGSSVCAAGAGILLALQNRPVPAGDSGIALTGLAVGAALLGGTSAFGRRGGICGTALAVMLVVGLLRLGTAHHWDLSPLAVGGAAILAGLVVTRLIEAYGRPNPATVPLMIDDDGFDTRDWSSPGALADEPPATPEADSWSTTSQTGGWTTQLSAEGGADSWGTGNRWSSR
jgi:ribose/xylose/arabinose/galactoside ABC-type transport system permease subunit